MNKNSIDDFTSGHTPVGRAHLPSQPQSQGQKAGRAIGPEPELDKKNTQAGGVTVSTHIGTTLCCQNDDLNNQGAEMLGAAMICGAAYAMSLSCSWCDRPQCGRDRRRLAPIHLGESAWCDVMHVLHSFGLGQLRLTLAAVAVLIALDALARFGDKCCETCLGGLARSAEKPSVQLCSILHVPSLELGSLPSQPVWHLGLATPLHSLHSSLPFASLLGLFWASSAPRCRNWLPPAPETSWAACVCAHPLVPRVWQSQFVKAVPARRSCLET